MHAQDIEALRGFMHLIEPTVGEVIYVPPGVIHSLGSGLCVLEPQEPTDWSILAEWEGFPYESEDGTLGLGWDLALKAADFSKLEMDELNGYIKRTPLIIRDEGGNREEWLLPDEATPYFQASRLVVDSRLNIPEGRGFHCLVILQGRGKLSGAFDDIPVERGKSVFIPACLSAYDIVNTADTPMEVVCCYPPAVS